MTALSSVACHTMAPATLDQLGTMKPSRAWVTLGDKSVVEISGPQIMGDTLVGYVNGVYQELPAATVKSVTVQKTSTGKTVALVVASTVAFGGFAYLITSAASNQDDKGPTVECQENPDRCM
ncbi:MAG TPA: hypothetical protein VLV16_09245 [Gemmatimonadales bacterium]|nr:hypothetical protein [Gemmatimonadales bacterium]